MPKKRRDQHPKMEALKGHEEEPHLDRTATAMTSASWAKPSRICMIWSVEAVLALDEYLIVTEKMHWLCMEEKQYGEINRQFEKHR